MLTKILLKRGLSSNITSLNLSTGEPAYTTDTGKLYIGKNGAAKTLVNPDLGTCANVNTGVSSGQIPLLDASGKFPQGVIPTQPAPEISLDYLFTYYTNNTDVSIGQFERIKINNRSFNTSSMSLQPNGSIAITKTGVYLISYLVSSASANFSPALISTSGAIFTGSTIRSASSSATPYCCGGATIITNLNSGDTIGIANTISTPINLKAATGGDTSLCITKIG